MLPSIAKHAASHQIHPLKKHGQNFIFDSSLCDKIVRASGLQENANVLEIGPGTAGLTRSILKMSPSKLTVIETDERCIPLLNEIKEYYPNLNIIKHDALKITLSDLMKGCNTKINLEKSRETVSREAERTKVREHSRTYKDDDANLRGSSSTCIISNLPYHIGTELVIRWLKEAHLVTSITVMLQKEVVERIYAKPSTKAYGRLSVICSLIAKVEKCFDVAPTAFYPPPKVYSAVVKLTPSDNIPSADLISKIELITSLAFAGRRKMIKSSLKNLSPNISELLAELNINDHYRAENLTPDDYLALANLL